MMCYCRCQPFIVKLLQQMPCMQSAAQLCLTCHTSAGWLHRGDGLICRIFAGEGDLGVKFF